MKIDKKKLETHINNLTTIKNNAYSIGNDVYGKQLHDAIEFIREIEKNIQENE